MADYESLRRRHSSYAMAQLDEHVAHIPLQGTGKLKRFAPLAG